MQSSVSAWNELFLSCVTQGNLAPTITARAMQIAHTAIFDAWAAFDPVAVGVNSRIEAPDALTLPAIYDQAVEEAVAYAAFTAAKALFPNHAAAINAFMAEMGYDPAAAPAGGSAAGIGVAAAQAVLDYRLTDYANASGKFADTTGYVAVNSGDPHAANAPGGPDFDPNHWQPLRVPTGEFVRLRISEDGAIKAQPVVTDNPASYKTQAPLTPQFGEVKAFSLTANYEFRPHAPPQLGDFSTYVDGNGKVTTNDAAYREQVAEVLAISAGLTDEQKAIAEFWADGPRTETPPGHWNQLAQDVAARDGNSLEDDVKMFFALNNALLDAAIATWETKYYYDSIRPQSAIRDMYFDETITAWLGPNRGIGEMLGQQWTPYQQSTFVTPPFPEYTSGHSAFSMAAATVLQNFTGSDTFYDGETRGAHDFDGDGLPDLAGEYVIDHLAFENYSGPPIALTWETFSEAAEEAGLSRLYGGIHFQDGNLLGRELGANVGESAWDVSQLYIAGSAKALLQSSHGTAADDLLLGSSAAETFDAGAGNDTVRPNGGGDTVTLGSGIDRIEGYVAALDDLKVTDFAKGDSIVFLDAPAPDTVSIALTTGGATITVGASTIMLDGDFGNGTFRVSSDGDDTTVTFAAGVRLSGSMFGGDLGSAGMTQTPAMEELLLFDGSGPQDPLSNGPGLLIA